MGYIKIRTFCLSKDTIKKLKSEGIECKKIIYKTNKGFISKIHKELLLINMKNTRRLKYKLEWKGHFTKRMSKWSIDMKRCSTSSVIREI